MRKMFSKIQITAMILEALSEANSLEAQMKNAVDLTGLPESGEMVSPYKEVIEKAMKSKCVKLNDGYYFISYFLKSDTEAHWYGGAQMSGDYAYSLVIDIDYTQNTYEIITYII